MPVDCGLRLTRTHIDMLRLIGRGAVPRASRALGAMRTLGLVGNDLQLTSAGRAVIEKQPRTAKSKLVRSLAGRADIASAEKQAK
jgi:hypothetical protein